MSGTLWKRLVGYFGEAVLESWRIDDEWWRPRPVSRLYYHLLL